MSLLSSVSPDPRSTIERTTRSQRKSKTTEAVANRGVDADAPRGENEDLRKERKTSRTDVYSERKRKGLSSVRLIW